MIDKNLFSDELQEVLVYMQNEIAKDELPTVIITPEYFFLAVLETKDNELYKTLVKAINPQTLDSIQASVGSYLSSKAMNVIKPTRVQKYNEKLTEYLDKSKEECKKMGDKEVTTVHVMLAILSDDSDDNKVRKIINAKQITYNKFSEIYKQKQEEIKNDEINQGTSETSNQKVIGIDLSKFPNPQELMGKIMAGEITPQDIMEMQKEQEKTNNKKTKSKTPCIDSFCTNLNVLAENKEIDRLIGRNKEIEEIIRILGRRKKNNAILVGSEGVGKTSIAENLASKIVEKEVPDFLLNKIVVSLDITALQAGTTLRGQFEERVKGLLNEIKTNGNYILFIDNISNVLNDKNKNEYDISGMISRSLETGELQVIGTSDYKAFRKTFDKDPALARRFQKIIVDTPTIEEALEIVHGIKDYYENYHHVKYTDEAIDTCVKLTNRYIPERNLPDSAIDVIDEAGSIIGTSADSNPEVAAMKKELNNVKFNINEAKQKENYKQVDELEKIEQSLNAQIIENEKRHKDYRIQNPEIISENVILELISKKTKIPINKLTADDKKRLANINERLKEEVIGQDEAIDTICKALKRSRIGLSNGKCLYSSMLIGKTGVGKCVSGNTYINIRNKKTGETERITIDEFKKRVKK